MGIRKKTLDVATSLLKGGIRLAAGSRTAQVYAHLAENLTSIIVQETDVGTVKFFCPGRIPLFRARTLLTKEPETIEWINTFDKEDVLWDIGANGAYIHCTQPYAEFVSAHLSQRRVTITF